MLTGMARAPKPSSCGLGGFRGATWVGFVVHCGGFLTFQISGSSQHVAEQLAVTTSVWTTTEMLVQKGPSTLPFVQVLRMLVSVQRCLKPEGDFGDRFFGSVLCSGLGRSEKILHHGMKQLEAFGERDL